MMGVCLEMFLCPMGGPLTSSISTCAVNAELYKIRRYTVSVNMDVRFFNVCPVNLTNNVKQLIMADN